MMEQLRLFLLTCPFLKPYNSPKIYINYLSATPTAYDLQIVPVSPIVKKYVDGGGIKQLVFILRSIEIYSGREISQNLDNIEFYEEFAGWLETVKPEIKGWIKTEPLTNGYFFDVEEGQDKATYQIQCRVLYNF